MDKKGFIYVMTNDSMPDLVKVGMSKKVPTERAKELEDTGVPKPYVAQYYAFFDDMFQAEKKAHKALSEYHYNKEFYKIDVATAIYHIENVGIPFTRLHSKPEDDRIAVKVRLKIQREQEEKERAEIKLHERKSREEKRKEAYLELREETKKVKKWFLNMHGHGTYTWPNGDKHEGEWGYGIMYDHKTRTWQNGDKYEGEWNGGEMNGYGTMAYGLGYKYEGEWGGHKMHGHGTYTWANGNKYEGEWQYNRAHGRGTKTYVSGEKYVGRWQDAKKYGKGTYTWPNGDKY